ncbi:MAG: metallophosphoesterase [Pseudomonadota bacterium]
MTGAAVVDVHDLDWQAVRYAADPVAVRARMQDVVTRMEAMLDSDDGIALLFDAHRASGDDRVIHVPATDETAPLWFIGDLHGDLLALESALACIRTEGNKNPGSPSRIVLLGDFVDDEGFSVETLIRIFELILQAPAQVTFVAGNHDEALSFDGTRFASSVAPSDFADFLNANLADEWIMRVGKLALRLTARAPRALFLPGGLLVTHGGFPLVDLHARLEEAGDWNEAACLADFTWARAHPKARRKMPNRFSRGSQFGHEDFTDFCALSTRMGRPVTHMVRGHDHVDDRYAIYPAYGGRVLTTVALSRRLGREQFGPHERQPTMALWVPGALPTVYRLHIPNELIHALFPATAADDQAAQSQADACAAAESTTP